MKSTSHTQRTSTDTEPWVWEEIGPKEHPTFIIYTPNRIICTVNDKQTAQLICNAPRMQNLINELANFVTTGTPKHIATDINLLKSKATK